MTAKIIEKTVPEQIHHTHRHPKGTPLMIMGTTPTAVVAEVRKIGSMRRRPASKAASLGL